MGSPAVIDAMYAIPRSGTAQQICDCVPYTEDLSSAMDAQGITAAVIAPRMCECCQYEWNCADRRTHEVLIAVEKNPGQMRGLACYDPLRIGESLRWIDEYISQGRLAGAFVQAERCIRGLDSARMYPLYGTCAKLRTPIVMNIGSAEGWARFYPQIEVVAADFPELDMLIAVPSGVNGSTIISLMQRFPRVAVMICPESLQENGDLLEYAQLYGRERILFRSGGERQKAVNLARTLSLGPAALRAYLAENCSRLFQFTEDLLQ